MRSVTEEGWLGLTWDLPNVAVRSGQLWTACDGCAVGTIGGAVRPSWNETPTENEIGASDGRRLGMEGVACAGIP